MLHRTIRVDSAELDIMLHCTNQDGPATTRPYTGSNDKMAEQTEKTVPTMEKVIAEQTARFEAAVAELARLQGKSVTQMNEFVEGANRVAHEQIAFAEQIGGEWRKLVLAATRSAADLFTPKA
jgi:hypothetical protein